MLPKIITVSTIVALMLLSCCDSDPPMSPRNKLPPGPFDVTPREHGEAEIVALWLSGELIAPQELYEEIRDGLTELREQFKDSIPAVYYQPRPHWVSGEIAGMFSEEAAVRVRSGTYSDMDSLNEALRLSRMDTLNVDWYNPKLLYFHLYFEGRLHPERLIEMYERIPSLLWVDNGYVFIGDRSQYYPWVIDDGVSYLFREAWGDCPAGCIYSEFWYFREVNSTIEYVGHWDRQAEPPPSWWDEAKTAPCELHQRFCY